MGIGSVSLVHILNPTHYITLIFCGCGVIGIPNHTTTKRSMFVHMGTVYTHVYIPILILHNLLAESSKDLSSHCTAAVF